MKTFQGMYKGFLIDRRVKHYFEGRNMIEHSSPFSKEVLERYKEKKWLIETAGVKWTRRQLKPIQIDQPRYANLLDGSFQCKRCLTTKMDHFVLYACSKCKTTCAYCRNCIQLGRITTCTTLLRWNETTMYRFDFRKSFIDWQGELTSLQQKAAKALVDCFFQQTSHLVYAVCGAGKTEVLFPLLLEGVKSKKKICIATPRTDVVLELYPRLQQAFPNTSIAALYGGHHRYETFPSIIITTTHQLIRFEEAFDVVIIDEVDAFPYSYDRTLQIATKKAKKKNAPVYFITATPSVKLLQQFKGNYSYIPIRFHQSPLPVPKIKSLFNYQKSLEKGRFPTKIKKWIVLQLSLNLPFLIFFPTVDLMKKAHSIIQSDFPSILCVHADDPLRKEKVLKLRKQEIQGLFTTTILERGITIKRLQVAVIGAEHEVFSSSALQQIAGRVGRSADAPTGEVLFFSHGASLAMDAAILAIEKHNKNAWR